VASLEHLISFCKGQGLTDYFGHVLSLVPQALNDDFQMNYAEVYEDFEELFEKKQLKVLNSMIFDETFVSFIINLQEMFEVRDSKSSHNEKLQLIEFYALSLKVNILVLMKNSKKFKFLVDDSFVNLTLYDDGNSLFVLFPYEYRDFTLEDDGLQVVEEEDMRKNLHQEIENQDPLTSPRALPTSPRGDLASPGLDRKSIGRLSSPPSSFQIEENNFQSRMAQRAKNFKEKRKIDIEKSPGLRNSGQFSGDFSILSRNLSADGFFQSRFRDSILDDSKLMNFRGDVTLDSKERFKWMKETELIKEEIVRREEIRKIEEKMMEEESKIKEIRRKEIENLIFNVKNRAQNKRIEEEKRLDERRKFLQKIKEQNNKNSINETLRYQDEVNLKKQEETEKILQEKKLAEQKIAEAQMRLEEAAKNFENLIVQEEIRLAEEHEKRMEEEKVLAEKFKLEEELKALELERIEKLKIIEEEENERKRLEDERAQQEIEEQMAEEEELNRDEEEKRLLEMEKEIEDERLEQEKIAEEEKANKERLRVQRLQEEKKKRAREEEEYLKNMKEKEAEKKRIADEKKAEIARKAEEKRLADEQKRIEEEQQQIEEQKRLEAQIKEEARRKKEEEDRRKQEEADRKKKEEADRKRKEDEDRKKKEEEDRKRKEEEDRKKKEEADRKKKEEADRKKKEEADRKRKEEEDRKRKEEEDRKKEEKFRQEEEKKRSSKIQEPEETYEETENTSFCGGIYCTKCARELKRSNYILKCDSCNDKYMKTGVASIAPASSVPQCKSCMNCSAKITKGEEVHCIRCFIQSKIFGESFSPCTGCVRTDKCYWIDVSEAEDRNSALCGFCDEKKAKDAVIVICSNCEDLICLVCLRKNPFVIQGICSNCHNRRVPRLR
jgi:hypothetical protein